MSVSDEFDKIADIYDSQRKGLIPCFDDFYSIAINMIDSKNDHPKVLDLGAGTGLLSYFLLQKYPKAEITLIDLAENMLNQAKDRFKDNPNISYKLDDYLSCDFNESFDVIMSSLSIHHICEDNKKKIYKKYYGLLEDDGIFLNADVVSSPSLTIEKKYIWSIDKLMKGNNLSDNEIEIANTRRRTFDDPNTLEDQLNWLREIGFRDVCSPYKFYNYAILYGKK